MVCDLCGKAYPDNGLEIQKVCVCSDCEREIIAAQVSDPDYSLWIERVKKIWERFFSIETPLSEEPIK